MKVSFFEVVVVQEHLILEFHYQYFNTTTTTVPANAAATNTP